jgi:myosin heavy subunit
MRRSFRKDRFVLEKSQSEMKSLLSAIEDTRTRYIKPNNNKIRRQLDHHCTMQQLERSGLVTAIQITRESFPNTLPYEFIFSRYACLMREKYFDNIGGMELKDKVRYVLSRRLQSLSKKNRDGTRTMPLTCGKTKAYFKAGCKERLEVLRLEYFHKNAITLQKATRRLLVMLRFSKARTSVIRLQARCRKLVVACGRWSVILFVPEMRRL